LLCKVVWGLISNIKVYVYPDGQFFMKHSGASPEFQDRVWRETFEILGTLTNKLISGDS